jgi:hypothetical protein
MAGHRERSRRLKLHSALSCGDPGAVRTSDWRTIAALIQIDHWLPRALPPAVNATGPHAVLMAIFFSLFCASGLFGSVTVSTPFLKCASILSASTPSGTPNERWKEP